MGCFVNGHNDKIYRNSGCSFDKVYKFLFLIFIAIYKQMHMCLYISNCICDQPAWPL